MRDTQAPEGWTVVRLEDVAKVNPRRPKLNVGEHTPVTFIPMAAVATNGAGIISHEERKYHEVASGYTYFEENDVLFAKITPCLQNGKQALACDLTRGFGFGTTEFHVIRPSSNISPSHLFRVLTQPSIIKKCEKSFSGTAGQQRVQPETLKSIQIVLPPLPEQLAISDVLDSIDNSIAGTEAVIRATERLRESLLHELLTCGVPGWHEEWKEVRGIGTMPSNWDVVRLGDVVEVSSGQCDPRERRFQDLLFIAPDDIESTTGRLIGRRKVADARAISGKYFFDQRDVLYSKIRPYLMKVCLPREPGLCSADIYPLRPQQMTDRTFLAHVLLSREFTNYTRTCSDRTGIPKINRADLLRYRFALPPVTEQQAIATLCEVVGQVVDQAETEKDALGKLKESVADALLTGRLRVTAK